MPTSRLEIDLSAVERNLAVVRSIVTPPPAFAEPAGGTPNAKPAKPAKVAVCAVLKQDGYGAGAVRLAKRLAAPPSGVDMLSVYSLDEARVLAEAVPSLPILVLMPVHGVDRSDPLYRHATAGRLHLTLHSADQLTAITELASRIGVSIPVHIQIDTGLTRGGVDPENAQPLLEKVLTSQRVRLAGLMTHFAAPSSDEQFTRQQARAFRDVVEAIKPAIRGAVASGSKAVQNAHELVLHAANSCATFRSRSLHGSMVRVGQSLLGYLTDNDPIPSDFEFAKEANALEPALRWTSSVVHIAEISPGSPVGYGSTWRAPLRPDGKKTKIALIPVGYADGYPRSLGGQGTGGPGWIGFTGRAWERRGSAESDDAGTLAANPLPTRYAPVVGRVSMDQITVDVTDLPESYLTCGHPTSSADIAGPEVEIFGRSRVGANFLPAMASAAGSITHESICRISPRVERVYRYPASNTEAPPTLRLPNTHGQGAMPGHAAVAR